MGNITPEHLAEIPQDMYNDMIGGRWNADCPIKIGDRVEKVKSEPGDLNTTGIKGKVVGNIYHPIHKDAYFILWDNVSEPHFVRGYKVQKV